MAVQKSQVGLKTALDRLKIKEEDVLNAYVIGSRLWGGSNQKSDWDLILVVSNWNGKATIHNAEFDATVFSEKEFHSKILEHAFFPLICLYIPESLRWKEKIDPRRDFKLDHVALRASILQETDRDWGMAQKYFEKGNVDRGKKTIVHALRLLLIAKQLIESGDVQDLHVSLPYTMEMREIYDKNTWPQFEEMYGPTYTQLRDFMQMLE
eukprot:TRINITY_DN9371_c0_g1_i2.p2 TRINITY_DN9371_c0_g1~~TRINITY_DN9371_c0_g1_i2.p2  ORF type:complete len:233 (-),score=33.53 TRINITY_DN9371_c0_g1_i2:797-1423(-)